MSPGRLSSIKLLCSSMETMLHQQNTQDQRIHNIDAFNYESACTCRGTVAKCVQLLVITLTFFSKFYNSLELFHLSLFRDTTVTGYAN